MKNNYRVLLYLLVIQCALLFAKSSKSQITAPAAYSTSIKINYVRTWDATSPQINADTLAIKSLKDVKQTTEYFDGLGRPLQKVIKKGSMITGDTARDLVSPVVYDEYGREKYKYLPFVANSTGGNTSISDGYFKINPFQQDSTFNKSQFSGENYFYSQMNFELSPLNRVFETFSPGNSWAGSATQSSESSRRSVKRKYWINTATDSVRIWNVTDVSNNFGTYTSSSTYPAGSLYKTVSLDENNQQVVEFKDNQGNIILKKIQLTATADTGTGKGHYGWLCTYYIYDDLNHIRCVIQPKGVEAIAGSWSLNSTHLDELCFRYEYDAKERISMKKVPGAGTLIMIYDARDRLVMSQDSVMRADHKWFYTLYDSLNRTTITGLITDGTYYNNAAYHRGQASSSITYPNPGGYTDEILTKTFYDDYSWRSGESNPLSATRSTTYDSYLLTASNTNWPYPQAVNQTVQLKGMVTGTKAKILGTSSTYLFTVNIYNDKGKTAQIQSTNHTGGTDITTTQYSFTGQPLIVISKTEKSGTNSQTSIVLNKLTYDDFGRTLKSETKISNSNINGGSMPGSWTTISQNEYNALGQLKRKIVGNNLDSLKYDYNIRSWLTGMNKEYINDSINAHWFGFELGYEKVSSIISSTTYATQQYNGNISGIIWKNGSDQEKRKYDFSYDNLNRLTSANFNQKYGSSWAKTDPSNSNFTVDYSLDSLKYDANGNILTMRQKGLKLTTSPVIDKMSYSYMNSGLSNKLLSVTEDGSIGTTDNKLGDFTDLNTSNDDYTYNTNGNLIADKNKRIDSIYYNHLNLPRRIRIKKADNSLKGIIEYTYDAVGNKLQKKTTEGSNVTITDYVNGFVYRNDTLQFAAHEEGRIRFTKKYFLSGDSAYALFYDYFIKDHLGNIRTVLTQERDTSKYMATMETARRSTEEALFYNISSTAYPIASVPDYPTDNTTSPNDYTSLTQAAEDLMTTDQSMGPSIALKVMAGDKFDVAVKSFFKEGTGQYAVSTEYTSWSIIYYLMGALSGQVSGLAPDKATAGDLATQGSPAHNGVTNFLEEQNDESTTINIPFAYLNWILLDEQFKYVPSGSGFIRVSTSNVLESLAELDIQIPKSGYLFVFVNNKSTNGTVYFDNLVVQHYTGPLTETTDYTAWGVDMKMIESKAFGRLENNKKFQEQEFAHGEFSDGSGLETYEFKWRMHDPQTGRFWQIDPLAEKYVYNSTYAFSENKVTGHRELEGLEAWSVNPKTLEDGRTVMQATVTDINAPFSVTQNGQTTNFFPIAEMQQRLGGAVVSQESLLVPANANGDYNTYSGAGISNFTYNATDLTPTPTITQNVITQGAPIVITGNKDAQKDPLATTPSNTSTTPVINSAGPPTVNFIYNDQGVPNTFTVTDNSSGTNVVGPVAGRGTPTTTANNFVSGGTISVTTTTQVGTRGDGYNWTLAVTPTISTPTTVPTQAAQANTFRIVQGVSRSLTNNSALPNKQ